MTRLVLTDGTGRWFSMESATLFKEETRWNGNNHISCATGSQWDHEALYRTAGGRYILNHWSQWQGSSESYEEISAEEAAVWLSKNDYDLEDANSMACGAAFAALEVL